MEDVNYTLFEPVAGKPMRSQYPELDKIDAFATLSDDEIKFCWYMGCKSSPYFPIEDPQEKILSCIGATKGTFSNDVRNKLADGNIPDRLFTAIKHFSIFDLNLRTNVYNLAQVVIRNANLIINKMPGEIQAMTLDEKKKYMDISTDWLEKAPDFINQMETKFGLHVHRKKDTSKSSSTQADKVMKFSR